MRMRIALGTMKDSSFIYVPNPPFNRNPDLFPTLARNENGAFPTVEERIFKYAQPRSLNRRTLTYIQFSGILATPTFPTITLETFSGNPRLDLLRMMTMRKISPDPKLPLPGSPRSLLAMKMRMASSMPKMS